MQFIWHLTIFCGIFIYLVSDLGSVQIKDMQTPPLSFDPAFMNDGECVICMGKIIKKLSDFYFSSCEKFIENWRFLEQKWRKMTITRKINIWKIWNLVFLFIQLIAVLSCKFDHFWKKILIFWILIKMNKKIWKGFTERVYRGKGL